MSSSSLERYRLALAALKAAQEQIEELQTDSTLQKKLEFESKLRSLMADYGLSLVDINELLDPNYGQKKPKAKQNDGATKPAAGKKPRATRCYKNPHTGEELVHTSGSNKTLNAWREQYGHEVVKSWSVLVNR